MVDPRAVHTALGAVVPLQSFQKARIGLIRALSSVHGLWLLAKVAPTTPTRRQKTLNIYFPSLQSCSPSFFSEMSSPFLPASY